MGSGDLKVGAHANLSGGGIVVDELVADCRTLTAADLSAW